MPKPQQQRKNPINEEIIPNKIMLVTESGEKLGVFKKDDALQKAEEDGLDVIQVGYDNKEGIAISKYMEYGKFQYQKKKEESEKKKNQKAKEMKEIKFGYNTGENDLNMKITKAKQFLEDGHQVRFVAVLKGRENMFAEKILKKMNNIVESLSDISKTQGVKEEKKGYSVILFPKIKQ